MGRGFLIPVALVVAWPLIAWLIVGLRRPPEGERWRPFAWTAAAATLVALAALVMTGMLLSRGDTTAAMTSLGYQLVALTSFLGSLVCGAISGALRKRSR